MGVYVEKKKSVCLRFEDRRFYGANLIIFTINLLIRGKNDQIEG